MLHTQRFRAIRWLSVIASVVALAGLTVIVNASQQDQQDRGNNNQNVDDGAGNALYAVHNLVSDPGGPKADHTDADLVNA